MKWLSYKYWFSQNIECNSWIIRDSQAVQTGARTVQIFEQQSNESHGTCSVEWTMNSYGLKILLETKPPENCIHWTTNNKRKKKSKGSADSSCFLIIHSQNKITSMALTNIIESKNCQFEVVLFLSNLSVLFHAHHCHYASANSSTFLVRSRTYKCSNKKRRLKSHMKWCVVIGLWRCCWNVL